MIKLLEKFFIKPNASEEENRTAYGILCGVAGIFLNVVLFIIKILAGTLSGAISVTADAFNNLSDAGSSIVTLLGFRMAAQKPDREHPYGHGRMEYIAGLGVSMIILLMGLDLLEESFKRILDPHDVALSPILVAVTVISVAVKCYMAFYNRTIGNRIASAPLHATAIDSLSDCFATGIAFVSVFVSQWTGWHLDGIGGLVVSLFVLWAGGTAAKDALNPLLGTPPEPEYIEKIRRIVLNFDEKIVGVHDLLVHDYGPGRRFISLHAEVPSDGDTMELHDIIDNLEKALSRELGCLATIHMDPIDVNDERTNQLKAQVEELMKELHSDITIHDFRMVTGTSHSNLVFDMVVPFDCQIPEPLVTKEAEKLIQERIGSQYYAVISLDRPIK